MLKHLLYRFVHILVLRHLDGDQPDGFVGDHAGACQHADACQLHGATAFKEWLQFRVKTRDPTLQRNPFKYLIIIYHH